MPEHSFYKSLKLICFGMPLAQTIVYEPITDMYRYRPIYQLSADADMLLRAFLHLTRKSKKNPKTMYGLKAASRKNVKIYTLCYPHLYIKNSSNSQFFIFEHSAVCLHSDVCK